MGIIKYEELLKKLDFYDLSDNGTVSQRISGSFMLSYKDLLMITTDEEFKNILKMQFIKLKEDIIMKIDERIKVIEEFDIKESKMKLRRLDENGTLEDTLTKLSEGNPGALHVCLNSYRFSPIIDPDNALGCNAPLHILDTFGIYGSRIWILYKDVCGEDIVKFIAVLRGMQLGIVDAVKLSDVLNSEDRLSLSENNIDVDYILMKVEGRFPYFNTQEIKQKVT